MCLHKFYSITFHGRRLGIFQPPANGKQAKKSHHQAFGSKSSMSYLESFSETTRLFQRLMLLSGCYENRIRHDLKTRHWQSERQTDSQNEQRSISAALDINTKPIQLGDVPKPLKGTQSGAPLRARSSGRVSGSRITIQNLLRNSAFGYARRLEID